MAASRSRNPLFPAAPAGPRSGWVPGTTILDTPYGVATNWQGYGSAKTGIYLQDTLDRLDAEQTTPKVYAGVIGSQSPAQAPMPGNLPVAAPVAPTTGYTPYPDTNVTETAPGGTSQAETDSANPNLTAVPAVESPNMETPVNGAEQSVADQREVFMAKGGSERTWRKAQVAAGRAPRIDARTRPSSQNSTASAEIRDKWGWGVDNLNLPY